jgi:hypothetical protein
LDDSLLYGPDGQLLFSNEFETMTSDGCLWCSSPVDEDDSQSIRWVICKPGKNAQETTSVLCPECSKPDSEAMKNEQWIKSAYGRVTEPIVEMVEREMEKEKKKKVTKTVPSTKLKKETTTVVSKKKAKG